MDDLYNTIRDTIKNYSDAARDNGKSQGFGDGYCYAVGYLQVALADAIWRIPADKRADVLRYLDQDTIRNLHEAKETV